MIPSPQDSRLLCTAFEGDHVLGYVAIDSTVGGRACGGLRLLPDVGEAEMVGLAAAMTLKYGFLGLPQGGAKAGVRGDPEAPAAERRRLLSAFARAIEPLLGSRRYAPGPDMGTSNADIREMLRAVGVRVGRRELRGERSGYYTALSVFAGVREGLGHLGAPLAGRTVAIEGFGKVGTALATMLDDAGAKVVAVSTSRGTLHRPDGLPVGELVALAGREQSHVVDAFSGARRLEREDLFELPVDLLCPCARHGSIHAGNAPRVQACVLSAGANNPVTAEAEEMLLRQGVLCLPDFVTNCGGVLGGTMEFASVSVDEIGCFVGQRLGGRIARLLAEAARRGVSPREVATDLSRRRFAEVQRAEGTPSPVRHLFRFALALYRRGLMPGRLVARLSMPYFERALS